jgi:hypothetical protein
MLLQAGFGAAVAHEGMHERSPARFRRRAHHAPSDSGGRGDRGSWPSRQGRSWALPAGGGFGGKRLKPFFDRFAFKRRIPRTQTNLVIEADDGLGATVAEFAYANRFGVVPLIKLDIRGINAPSDDGRPVVDAVAAPSSCPATRMK